MTPVLLLLGLLVNSVVAGGLVPFHAQGEKAGDPTQDSVILLTRLTAVEKGEIECDVPGATGIVRFEVSETETFKNPKFTAWAEANELNDFTVKQAVTGLRSGTPYFYRVHLKTADGTRESPGPVRYFKTAYAPNDVKDVNFVAMSCMGYQTRDSDEGHISYQSMRKLNPDFIVLTGDTVYYDGMAGGIPSKLTDPVAKISDRKDKAKFIQDYEMQHGQGAYHLLLFRQHWHAMYALPATREFFGTLAGYWEVDDHDYFKDDCDFYSEVGSRVFREQNPVPDKTWRSARWGKSLEIWLPEGRELRDKKSSPPTILGKQQLEWLIRSISTSKATFKLLISSTPVVGCGEPGKSDNLASVPFLEERKAFFDALKASGVRDFFVICGDRHWKYHSTSREYGIEEFGTGSLSDKHGVKGYKEDKSPGGLVTLHYSDQHGLGGFAHVSVKSTGAFRGKPVIAFELTDSRGTIVHSKTHTAVSKQ